MSFWKKTWGEGHGSLIENLELLNLGGKNQKRQVNPFRSIYNSKWVEPVTQ
jgi:hypothetical protein